MNKRSIIAAVLVTIGFLLIVGAVGSMDYGSIGVKEALVRSAIGAGLIGIATLVNGVLKRGDNDEKVREERQRNKGRGRSDC